MNITDFLPKVDPQKLQNLLEIKHAFQNNEISLTDAQKLLKEKVGTLKPYEIALAEQTMEPFKEDECQKADIQEMLLLYEGILDTTRPQLPDNHPIAAYYYENDKMREFLLAVEDLVQYPLIKNQWKELYEELEKFKIHLSRKQNQLYSLLEKKGFDRPTTTMWILDNYIRDEISEAHSLLNADKDDEFIAKQSDVVADIRDLMEKEETVLYPTSLIMINDEEFEDMIKGDQEIGYGWKKENSPTKTEKKATDFQTEDYEFLKDLKNLIAKHGLTTDLNQPLDVSTGKLTLEQINLIFRHLPVDLSYVDEKDIVCFYSDTPHRVFPRSKNVIGRIVQNCHPRTSVAIVNEIIEKFRSGEESQVDFWINKPGFFVYIHYTAVRDEEGKFRGILEMMQNCTHIRSLEGSRTLLTWGSGKSTEVKGDNDTKETTDTSSECKASYNNEIKTMPELNADTALKTLIEQFPALKEELIKINPKFKLLNTPLAKIMLPKATLGMLSERSGMPLEELIEKIRTFLKTQL